MTTKKNKRATLKDIAKLANVSISTASIALNGKGMVSEDTKKSILKAAKELSYKPNTSARYLRTSKTKIIGLLIPDVRNSYYNEIIESIRLEVEKQGYFLLLAITGNNTANEEKYINEFVSRGVDGVIIVPQLTYIDDTSYINILDKYDIPYIFLAAKYEKSNKPFVMCDLYKGCFEVTEYLLNQKLSKIFLLIGDKRVDKMYIEGFCDAFYKRNLEVDKNWIYESSYEFEKIQEAGKIMFKYKPEAIVTNSDLMACALIQEAKKHDIKIPKDMSITGYDDVIYAIINQTPVTTVKQPIKEMCIKTVEKLICMIEKNIIPESEILETKIIIRDSTINKIID